MLFTGGLCAQSQRERKTASATRIGEDVILSVDGVLDEAEWKDCIPLSDFLQKEPNEGNAPKEKTEVRFAYDEDALYIGAVMYTVPGTSVQSTMSRRDNTGNSERIIFSIDSYNDKRTAYTFGVTASGVRFDYYHAEDREFVRDYSFDPVWEAKVTIAAEYWSAEMRIPFSQLRFHEEDSQEWGLNINRFIPTTQEDLYWVMIPKIETGWSSRFGTLTGIRNIRPTHRIEIIPYTAGDATFHSDRDPRNPFDNGSNLNGRFGGDLKMGLGPNLTLDATINPDFGQVDADPAEVNLSAFETFYSERRPFFIEGSKLLQGDGQNYFYSRRIGAPPHLEADGDFVEVTKSTVILGAAKVSGRLQNGLSIAALTAITANAYQKSFSLSDMNIRETRVEPLTGSGVVRVQQEFGEEGSTIGVMFTGLQRDVSDDEPIASLLSRQAISGGADWSLRFSDGTYILSGFTGFSSIQGTNNAMIRAQRSSARYFQRPDATHIHVDSSATHMAGYTASLQFSKDAGEHWLWGTGWGAESPGFELNDLGRISSTDDIDSWAYVRYRETVPGTTLRGYGIELFTESSWNFEAINQILGAQLSADITWKNYWSTSLSFGYEARELRDELTRGGPLMQKGEEIGADFSLSTNYSLPTHGYVSIHGNKDEVGSRAYGVDAAIIFRPGAQWELSIEPRFNRSIYTRQYVATVSRNGGATFGQRYIFASIDRVTVSTSFRVGFSLTPDISLELYAEPFVASGRFYDFGELAVERGKDLRRYGTDGSTITQDAADRSYTITDGNEFFTLPYHDFNVFSFRSNLVLRWEWLRGSTLFFIWQQNRFAAVATDASIQPESLFRSLDQPGSNYLALKISYWLSAS